MRDNLSKGQPCVIVDGSGRAADILAYAYRNAIKNKVSMHVQGVPDFFLIDRFQVLDPHYIQNPQFGTTLHNPDPHSRILTNRVNKKQLLVEFWNFGFKRHGYNCYRKFCYFADFLIPLSASKKIRETIL